MSESPAHPQPDANSLNDGATTPETPLGHQNPLGSSTPLGQRFLSPQFLSPLGAQSLLRDDPLDDLPQGFGFLEQFPYWESSGESLVPDAAAIDSDATTISLQPSRESNLPPSTDTIPIPSSRETTERNIPPLEPSLPSLQPEESVVDAIQRSSEPAFGEVPDEDVMPQDNAPTVEPAQPESSYNWEQPPVGERAVDSAIASSQPISSDISSSSPEDDTTIQPQQSPQSLELDDDALTETAPPQIAPESISPSPEFSHPEPEVQPSETRLAALPPEELQSAQTSPPESIQPSSDKASVVQSQAPDAPERKPPQTDSPPQLQRQTETETIAPNPAASPQIGKQSFAEATPEDIATVDTSTPENSLNATAEDIETSFPATTPEAPSSSAKQASPATLDFSAPSESPLPIAESSPANVARNSTSTPPEIQPESELREGEIVSATSPSIETGEQQELLTLPSDSLAPSITQPTPDSLTETPSPSPIIQPSSDTPEGESAPQVPPSDSSTATTSQLGSESTSTSEPSASPPGIQLSSNELAEATTSEAPPSTETGEQQELLTLPSDSSAPDITQPTPNSLTETPSPSPIIQPSSDALEGESVPQVPPSDLPAVEISQPDSELPDEIEHNVASELPQAAEITSDIDSKAAPSLPIVQPQSDELREETPSETVPSAETTQQQESSTLPSDSLAPSITQPTPDSLTETPSPSPTIQPSSDAPEGESAPQAPPSDLPAATTSQLGAESISTSEPSASPPAIQSSSDELAEATTSEIPLSAETIQQQEVSTLPSDSPAFSITQTTSQSLSETPSPSPTIQPSSDAPEGESVPQIPPSDLPSAATSQLVSESTSTSELDASPPAIQSSSDELEEAIASEAPLSTETRKQDNLPTSSSPAIDTDYASVPPSELPVTESSQPDSEPSDETRRNVASELPPDATTSSDISSNSAYSPPVVQPQSDELRGETTSETAPSAETTQQHELPTAPAPPISSDSASGIELPSSPKDAILPKVDNVPHDSTETVTPSESQTQHSTDEIFRAEPLSSDLAEEGSLIQTAETSIPSEAEPSLPSQDLIPSLGTDESRSQTPTEVPVSELLSAQTNTESPQEISPASELVQRQIPETELSQPANTSTPSDAIAPLNPPIPSADLPVSASARDEINEPGFENELTVPPDSIAESNAIAPSQTPLPIESPSEGSEIDETPEPSPSIAESDELPQLTAESTAVQPQADSELTASPHSPEVEEATQLPTANPSDISPLIQAETDSIANTAQTASETPEIAESSIPSSSTEESSEASLNVEPTSDTETTTVSTAAPTSFETVEIAESSISSSPTEESSEASLNAEPIPDAEATATSSSETTVVQPNSELPATVETKTSPTSLPSEQITAVGDNINPPVTETPEESTFAQRSHDTNSPESPSPVSERAETATPSVIEANSERDSTQSDSIDIQPSFEQELEATQLFSDREPTAPFDAVTGESSEEAEAIASSPNPSTFIQPQIVPDVQDAAAAPPSETSDTIAAISDSEENNAPESPIVAARETEDAALPETTPSPEIITANPPLEPSAEIQRTSIPPEQSPELTTSQQAEIYLESEATKDTALPETASAPETITAHSPLEPSAEIQRESIPPEQSPEPTVSQQAEISPESEATEDTALPETAPAPETITAHPPLEPSAEIQRTSIPPEQSPELTTSQQTEISTEPEAIEGAAPIPTETPIANPTQLETESQDFTDIPGIAETASTSARVEEEESEEQPPLEGIDDTASFPPSDSTAVQSQAAPTSEVIAESPSQNLTSPRDSEVNPPSLTPDTSTSIQPHLETQQEETAAEIPSPTPEQPITAQDTPSARSLPESNAESSITLPPSELIDTEISAAPEEVSPSTSEVVQFDTISEEMSSGASDTSIRDRIDSPADASLQREVSLPETASEAQERTESSAEEPQATIAPRDRTETTTQSTAQEIVEAQPDVIQPFSEEEVREFGEEEPSESPVTESVQSAETQPSPAGENADNIAAVSDAIVEPTAIAPSTETEIESSQINATPSSAEPLPTETRDWQPITSPEEPTTVARSPERPSPETPEIIQPQPLVGDDSPLQDIASSPPNSEDWLTRTEPITLDKIDSPPAIQPSQSDEFPPPPEGVSSTEETVADIQKSAQTPIPESETPTLREDSSPQVEQSAIPEITADTVPTVTENEPRLHSSESAPELSSSEASITSPSLPATETTPDEENTAPELTKAQESVLSGSPPEAIVESIPETNSPPDSEPTIVQAQLDARDESQQTSRDNPQSSISISDEDISAELQDGEIRDRKSPETDTELTVAQLLADTTALPSLPTVLENLAPNQPLGHSSLLPETPNLSGESEPVSSSRAEETEPIIQRLLDSAQPSRPEIPESWSSIAELLGEPETVRESSPAIASPSDSSPELPQSWGSIADLMQTSPVSESQPPTIQRRTEPPPVEEEEIIFTPEGFRRANTTTFPTQTTNGRDAPVETVSTPPPPTTNEVISPIKDTPETLDEQNFEILAREVYQAIQQRLAIDRERRGGNYSGRLPW